MAASVDDSNSAAVEDDPVELLAFKTSIEQHELEEKSIEPHSKNETSVLQETSAVTSHGATDETSVLQDSSSVTSHEATDETSVLQDTSAVTSHEATDETSCVASIQNLLLQSNIVKVGPGADTDDLTVAIHQNLEQVDSTAVDDTANNNTQATLLVENAAQNLNCASARHSEQGAHSTEQCSKESVNLQSVAKAPETQEDAFKLPNLDVIINGDIAMLSVRSDSSENVFDTKAAGAPEIDTKASEKEERPVREMLVRRKRSESTETSSENKPVLETLTFGAIREDGKSDGGRVEGDVGTCLCVLCDRSYPAYNKEDILAHLVLMHKFVIADVNYIANLPAYLKYWKKRLEEKPITEFCSKIVTNTGVKDEAPKEEFFLLCDALPEDKDLREHLQRKKLEAVLVQQQREREETKFCRQCLFCKQTYCGNRAVLFDHLLRDHTFHMGQPDNLVFTDELFDLIQSKLDNQLCLFCEKSFKDKASLREHMRKKQHRKINPKNKEYDRFYIINYMEMGKNWESLQSEDNRLLKTADKASDEEDEWSGWEEESQSKVVCLFCDVSLPVQADLQKHMKDIHGFDLLEVNHKLHLNFYQKVKLINYIRRQVYHKTCYGCQESFSNKESLNSHMENFSEHLRRVPDASVWDQPQYFFPTYEDDTLLCQLDDDDDGASGDALGDTLGVTVIAEDIPVPDTILSDQKLRKDLSKA